MAKRESIWNVPNMLTMLRMALIVVFVWLYATGYRYWAMAVFIIASLTDILDGYIARKHQLVTSFGKLMDPLADKLMVITALICLTADGLVPLWLLIVVICKELFMVLGGYFLLKHGVVVQAQPIGKVATVVFVIAIVATLLHAYLAPWDQYLQYLAVTLSVAAMFWYLVQIIRAWRARK